MAKTSIQFKRLERRKLRTRATLAVNLERPRLSVHKSNRHIYAQIIDDKTGHTLASAHDLNPAKAVKKTEQATIVGESIAKAALAKKVKAIRFDRGANQYHGRVAALADAARKAGLEF